MGQFGLGIVKLWRINQHIDRIDGRRIHFLQRRNSGS
jgi:hypothetical protein